MAELKSVEYFYRDGETRECTVTKHFCEFGDCRQCRFAQEAFRFDLQMKLEDSRRKYAEEKAKSSQVEAPIETKEEAKPRKRKD